MRRCPDCNKRLRKDATNCPRCGWRKRKFGFNLGFFNKKLAEAHPMATGTCPHCGRMFYHSEKTCNRCGWKKTSYRAGFGLVLFSLLIPIFGWIYGEVMKYAEPRKAATCRVISTISFILFLFVIAYLAN